MTVDPPARIGRAEIFSDPGSVAERLLATGEIFGLIDIEVRIADHLLVCFWLTLAPWQATADEGYPVEKAAITAWSDGALTAVPIAARGRQWLHRNATMNPAFLGSSLWKHVDSALPGVRELAARRALYEGDPGRLGSLCIWYPGDPPTLRWGWRDGFAAYITIVHRHLQAEEFWRRTGSWPAEDAPHGHDRHPIRTSEMRRAARQKAA